MSEKMNSCHCPSRRLPLPVNPLADDQIFFWVGRPSGFTGSKKKKKKKGGGISPYVFSICHIFSILKGLNQRGGARFNFPLIAQETEKHYVYATW